MTQPAPDERLVAEASFAIITAGTCSFASEYFSMSFSTRLAAGLHARVAAKVQPEILSLHLRWGN